MAKPPISACFILAKFYELVKNKFFKFVFDDLQHCLQHMHNTTADLTLCASTILTRPSECLLAKQITPSMNPTAKLLLSSYQATLHTGTNNNALKKGNVKWQQLHIKTTKYSETCIKRTPFGLSLVST